MYVDDFVKLFMYEEVHSFPLVIQGKEKTIYIRRGSFNMCARYRRICQTAAFRAEYDGLINAGKGTDEKDKKIKFPAGEIEYSEFYLLRNSICDTDGKILFLENDKIFNKWIGNVGDDLANDILLEVLYFNKIIDRPDEEPGLSDEKKKTS